MNYEIDVRPNARPVMPTSRSHIFWGSLSAREEKKNKNPFTCPSISAGVPTARDVKNNL